ncbi:hydantoinase/oxoprolinase family protein [Nocardiopsis ansamitocini]|uniref:Hydantoinase n=1 Tax=Nocardiopsis ansamitocini TaxID=1670832 RepID=A0A9W6PB56_9ACTN|nr:hydantoinase/oxoprolinase family protein [Nocardiopsis ansamitocini]GLU50323.1 hydantoinase [Nocardiopsis ansamitocini]
MTGTTPRTDLRIGVDVGGTNTDAVVLDGSSAPLARAKVATTANVNGGIGAALEAVLAAPGVAAERVGHVMIGTTHATNALLERSNLVRVAALRVGAPASNAVRPMYGWPASLRTAVSAHSAIVRGGLELDGSDSTPFDTDAVARFCAEAARSGAEAVAVSSVFAPVSPRHEELALATVRRELGDIPVSLSHQVGSLGLLERENATILNAALGRVAVHVIRAIEEALREQGLDHAVPYFAQNDGTLMSLESTERTPVLTIGSGPANSLRGAAYLTGVSDALVADVGGTSTDIGALAQSFPRESAFGVEIGGVATNFRMPDLVSIAIGGGTTVAGSPGGVTVGPRSVGYELGEKALVFGGPTATLSDAAVAAGRATIGDRAPAPSTHPLLAAALKVCDQRIADAVDRIKVTRGDLPLIAVGGGSVLVPEGLPGVTTVIRPDHYDVANAIGAAIGTVSGNVDRVFSVGSRESDRARVLDEARGAAVESAIAAGAAPDSVEIIEIDEIPLSYLREPAVRVRVKAAGPLSRM